VPFGGDSARSHLADISTRVLATGEKGIYPAERFEGLSAMQLRNYWQRGERIEAIRCHELHAELRADWKQASR
jgi:chemotaxis methyl-accepting protein methylase